MTHDEARRADGEQRGRKPAVLAAIMVAVAVVALLPPTRARLVAAPTLAEALGTAPPRPLAGAVERRATELGGVAADRYAGGGPGVVLVPGATRAGRDDTRVIRAATAIARAGRDVVVPELALYDRVLEPDDIERIRSLTRALATEHGGPVTLVGMSYGGAYSLVAVAQEEVAAAVALVATFGSYFDLVGVLQAATTGTSIVDGARFGWDPAPASERILVEALAEFVARDEQVAFMQAAAAQRKGEGLASRTRALLDLLANDDPTATAPLVAALPRELIARLNAVSPAAVATDIDVPVIALHAADDPAVPVAEAERLRRGLPHARVTVVNVFEHVDLADATAGEWLRETPDLLRVWRYGGRVLGATEPTAPATLRRLGR